MNEDGINEWSSQETSSYQDRVIAHVLGATVLGYLILDEAAHLLLDMGFIWTIYLDGEMGLLPQSVLIAELELDEARKLELLAEIQRMHDGEIGEPPLFSSFAPAPGECLILEVSLQARDDGRRILLRGEEASLLIETSLSRREICIMSAENNAPTSLHRAGV